MKRCPTCEKTFDDNMRFCQADGTPLVEDAAPLDPYKTMVARPEDIAAAGGSQASDDVLDLPADSDPAKTMYASEEEIRAEMNARSGDDQVIDIPPLVDPEPPVFSEPSPPPSPFSSPDISASSVPPIPSPFDDKKPSTYEPPPLYIEPEPVRDEPVFNPFDQPSSQPIAEWTPPPAPESSWQNQEIGQNTPFQPPVAAVSGQSSVLAIISVVVGVLGIVASVVTMVNILCGIIPFAFGVGAIIMGFLGRSRAIADPSSYGGKGIATGGIIVGILAIIATIAIGAIWTLLVIGMMNADSFR